MRRHKISSLHCNILAKKKWGCGLWNKGDKFSPRPTTRCNHDEEYSQGVLDASSPEAGVATGAERGAKMKIVSG
jgi:hypothetical protein